MKLRPLLVILFCLWFGVPADAANRFWVGGTGEVNPTNTANWSATSGGAPGASVPGVADTAIWDAASGGGVVTLNFGGTWTVQSITLGAFTGTWDNSVNNNNVVVTSNGSAFSGSGSGVRNIKLGSATYTLTNSQSTWQFLTTTNLTFSGNLSTIVFSGSGIRQFTGGNLPYGTLNIGATTTNGDFSFSGAAGSFTAINVSAPNTVRFIAGNTTTITNLTAIGLPTTPISLVSTTINSPNTTLVITNLSASYTAIRDLIFSGAGLKAINSFDLQNNTNIQILPPGGAQCVGC